MLFILDNRGPVLWFSHAWQRRYNESWMREPFWWVQPDFIGSDTQHYGYCVDVYAGY